MNKVRWHILCSLLVFHLAAFVGWIAFSWEGVLCCLVMYVVTAMGITGGYHRLLTHDSFKTVLPIRWAFTLAGMAAGQGSPVEWVAHHRKHHKFSDEDGDPHSPHHGGFWWSHLLWMLKPVPVEEKNGLYRRYAKDLVADSFLRMVSRKHFYAMFFFGSFLAIGLIGWLLGGWKLFWSFLAYGVFIRLVLVYHVTWAVNSATHLWGYRNHETTDHSRNLWWVGLLAFGEGWHNNHHSIQRAANHGQRWWEIDMTYWLIWLLARFKLAWNVCVYNISTEKIEVLYKR